MKLRLGRVSNTHGIKGELRIISNFEHKNKAFKPDFKLYFKGYNTPEVISTYRPHKEYDMVTLKGYNNINEVLKFKGLDVFIEADDLNLNEDEYAFEELIGLNCIFNDKNVGLITEIMYNNGNNLLIIKKEKEYFVPINKHFIKKVDKDKKEVILDNIEGLM